MKKFLLMNAAGWAKTLDRVRQLTKVPTISHIVMGSFTMLSQEEISGTTFTVGPDGTSVNSMQLPNGGIVYLEKHGREMCQMVRESGKKPVISIAGSSPSQYAELAEVVADLGAIIELSVGCPNARRDGKQQEIISYNFPLLQNVLQSVFLRVRTVPLWIKPSPYANPADRVRFVELVKYYENSIHAVVAANTFPNVSMCHEDGRPYLTVANNYGGMGGTGLKCINLSQARDYAQLLPDMPILGSGGIGKAQDALDYARVKCTGGQIGTAFFHNENLRIFQEVAEACAEEV